MRLYLVQHGMAKSKEEDPDRHLTEKGLQEVQKVTEFLKPVSLHLQAFWHSDKARAIQTAEVLASVVDAKEGRVQRNDLGPNDSVAPVRKELELCKEDLMIVAHLPLLSKLASSLLVGNELSETIAFQQGAVVCLEHLPQGTWTVAWMLTPELLSGTSAG